MKEKINLTKEVQDLHTANYNNGVKKKDLKKQKDILCLHTKAHNIKMTVFLKCNLYQEFNCFF